MLEEFKKFALRGNVVDLAVGVIIGAAFGAIVTSLVDDIIMPIIGAITGGLDFSNYYIPLSSKVQPDGLRRRQEGRAPCSATAISITVAINFLIIAFVFFLVIRGINLMVSRNKKEQAAEQPPPPPAEVALLTDIRDQLSSLNSTMAKR